MVEKRAQLADRRGKVGAKHLLAEEIEEEATGGRLAKSRAPLVARRMPRVLVPRGEGHKRSEHRRQDRSAVGGGGVTKPAGDPVGGIVEQVDVLIDVPGHGGRDVGERGTVGHQPDRQAVVLFAGSAQQRQRVGGVARQIPVDHGDIDRRVCAKHSQTVIG